MENNFQDLNNLETEKELGIIFMDLNLIKSFKYLKYYRFIKINGENGNSRMHILLVLYIIKCFKVYLFKKNLPNEKKLRFNYRKLC